MHHLPRRALRALTAPGWVLAAALPAQDSKPAKPDRQTLLAERRDKKLASEFLKKASWHTDFAAAKKAAAESGKNIFAYFTRSFSP